jgi:DNA-binding NarL/FixJ family response regulator
MDEQDDRRSLTDRKIGAEMFLAEDTVKDYLSSLLALPGLERRTRESPGEQAPR